MVIFVPHALTHGERRGGAGSIAAPRRRGYSTAGREPATIRGTDVGRTARAPMQSAAEATRARGEMPGMHARRTEDDATRCNAGASLSVFDPDRP